MEYATIVRFITIYHIEQLFSHTELQFEFRVQQYFDFYDNPIHMICDTQVIFKSTVILKKNFFLIFDQFKVTSDMFFVFPCNGIYDLQAE